MEKFKIPVNNQYIHCTLFAPKTTNRKTTVIFVHGWTSSEKKYLPLAEQLAQLGFTCLTVNLRGHNDSQFNLKQLSRQQHLEDIQSSYNYMKSLYPENKIGILGKSFGGYLTSILSSRVHLDFMIIVCPALYPNDYFDSSTFQFLQKNPHAFRTEHGDKTNNIALRAFSEFNKPVLFIEVEHDEEVKQISPGLYLKNTNNPHLSHEVIKNSDHSLTKQEWKDKFYSIVVNWLL